MTRATCTVNVVFKVLPQHADAFQTAVLQQAKNSLEKEDWCHQFDVCVLPDEPGKFLLYETYDDRAAFARHRETEHFAQFTKTIDGWVVDKDVAIWDILEPAESTH